MRLQREVRPWRFPLVISAVATFVLIYPLSQVINVEFYSALVIGEILTFLVGIAVRRLVVRWTKDDILYLCQEKVNWESYRSEFLEDSIDHTYFGGGLYHAIDVPRYGPWYPILGLAFMMGFPFSILIGMFLEIAIWKALILGITVSSLVAPWSGFCSFLWAIVTRQKLLRHTDSDSSSSDLLENFDGR